MSSGSERAVYSSHSPPRPRPPAATRRDFPFIPTLSFHRLHSLPISEAGETDQIDDFGERTGLAGRKSFPVKRSCDNITSLRPSLGFLSDKLCSQTHVAGRVSFLPHLRFVPSL